MGLIDTHAHLAWPDLSSNIEGVISRASNLGVASIIGVSSSVSEGARLLSLINTRPGIFACIGIHPQDTAPDTPLSLQEQFLEMRKMILHEKVVGVGEFGYDFSVPPANERSRDKKEQDEIFNFQANLALENNLPVCIHSRNAKNETLEALSRYKLRGVWHCFVEDLNTAHEATKMGYYLSFNGILTYKSGKTLAEVAKSVPLDRILLETDAPFLLPEPLRSNPKVKNNEPSYVKIVAKALAEIKGVSLAYIEDATSENASCLFNL